MATETTTDIYRLDAADAEGTYKRLADLAEALTDGLKVQVEQSTAAASALSVVAEASKKAEAASVEHARGLKELGDETKKTRAASESLADHFKKDLQRTLLSTAAVYDLLKEGMRRVIDLGRESITMALEEERADIRLANAIKVAGYAGSELQEALHMMADGFEATTHVSGETIKAMQEVFVEFGVAPAKIKDLTQAVLDYATLTGKDAVTASRELVGAIRGESDSVTKLKLDLTGMNSEAERTDAVIKAIAGTMGGTALANAKGFGGALDGLGTSFENLQKALGKFAIRTLDNPAMGLLGNVLAPIIGRNPLQLGNVKGDLDDVTSRLNKLLGLESNAIEKGAKLADGVRGKITVPTLDFSGLKDKIEAEKAAQKAMEKIYAENLQSMKTFQRDSENQDFIEEDRNAEALRKKIATAQEWLKEDEKFQEAGAEQARRDMERIVDIEERKNAQILATRKEFFHSLLKQAEDFSTQIVRVGLDDIAASIQQNSAYTAKLKEASIERRQLDLAEQGVIKSRAEVEQEAAAEADAANKKKLASVLAAIAVEAQVKAIEETAAAIASAAEYDYGGAALHGGAAVAYGAVAIAAGGASLALSQSRGQTSDERASLEAFDKKKSANADARATKQAGETGGGNVGTQVNVYQIGISGYTQTQQARELAKIQKAYGQLGVGGGGL